MVLVARCQGMAALSAMETKHARIDGFGASAPQGPKLFFQKENAKLPDVKSVKSVKCVSNERRGNTNVSDGGRGPS
jgi:hypothetical protein